MILIKLLLKVSEEDFGSPFCLKRIILDQN
jgi:hypothetical protein